MSKGGTVLCIALLLLAASPGAASQNTRVVTLVPSLAEDFFAIGAGSQVVGVSAYTDIPAAKQLPVVADFSSVDTEKIVALRPDAVVGIPAQARLVDPLRRAGINVVLISDDGYGDIFTDIVSAGSISGHEREAHALVARLSQETEKIRARTRAFKRKPSVFVVLGTGPIWTVGEKSYIAHLIALAGGRNAADALDIAYGQYSAEAMLRAQPDALVTDPSVHLDAVLDREPWRSLRAVTFRRVYTVDPAAILERPGPRYNEGLLWLVERLTPLAT